jgi:hypothetical protein
MTELRTNDRPEGDPPLPLPLRHVLEQDRDASKLCPVKPWGYTSTTSAANNAILSVLNA